MRATIGKVFCFEAAHQLPNHLGKCARLHGHSYRLEVELEGPVKPATGEPDEGMVLDFGEVSAVVKPLVERLDHHNLNDVMPDDYLPSTAENLARYVLAELNASDVHFSAVIVWETATAWVRVTA